MADQQRLESSVTPDPVDRDSRAEVLLVDGLDRYFSGRYEEAIHLWTRVLFFDRSHARARAYIDRARTALAERQRRTEELLARAEELLTGGQVEPARALFAQAVSAGGDEERVARMRARLERVDRARADAGASAPAAIVDAVPIGPRRAPRRMRPFATGLVVLAAVVVGAIGGPLVEGWMADRSGAAVEPMTGGPAALAVLSSSETALVRARALYARGRLAEALRALDRVDARSPEWSTADQLRVEIQQILLASRRGLAAPVASTEATRP